VKSLRRPALLVLSLIAALSLGVSANAAPNTGGRSVVAEAGGDAVSPSGAGSPAAPLALVSYISNENDIGIGVQRVYTGPGYSAILAGHRRTDGAPLNWDRAESYYIGPGYCADADYWRAGAWHRSRTGDRGPVTVRVQQAITGESVARWAVKNVRSC
jgi:hypothetical protein